MEMSTIIYTLDPEPETLNPKPVQGEGPGTPKSDPEP
jgi:hypothetical protein